MIYCDRIEVIKFEGININKTSASEKCTICH